MLRFRFLSVVVLPILLILTTLPLAHAQDDAAEVYAMDEYDGLIALGPLPPSEDADSGSDLHPLLAEVIEQFENTVAVTLGIEISISDAMAVIDEFEVLLDENSTLKEQLNACRRLAEYGVDLRALLDSLISFVSFLDAALQATPNVMQLKTEYLKHYNILKPLVEAIVKDQGCTTKEALAIAETLHPAEYNNYVTAKANYWTFRYYYKDLLSDLRSKRRRIGLACPWPKPWWTPSPEPTPEDPEVIDDRASPEPTSTPEPDESEPPEPAPTSTPEESMP